MSLELAVARALHGARVLERALNERTGWTISIGAVEAPATRTMDDRGVVFRTTLPDIRLRFPNDQVVLSHMGVMQAVRPFQAEGDGPFDVVFELRLVDPVSV